MGGIKKSGQGGGGESQVGGRKIYLCFQNTNIKFLTEIMKTTKLHLSLGPGESVSLLYFCMFSFQQYRGRGGIGLTKYMLVGDIGIGWHRGIASASAYQRVSGGCSIFV